MRVVAFSLFLLLSVVCAPAMAQTDALDEKQKAVVVFDIRMDSVRNSDLAKKMKLADKISQMHEQSGDDGPNPTKIDRVMGAMSAPENMESAMSIQMGEMPMNFFVKMYFNDPAEATKLVEKAKEDNGGTVERDGKTFYKLPEQAGAPEGIVMHQVDDKTLEIGTESYLFRADRNVMTANLAAASKSSPDAAVRLALDLDGAKGLVSELVAVGKQQAPDPTVGVYMDLIDNVKDISIVLDVSGGDLLTIKANGVSEDEAVELKEGLDSLLGMAKMGIQTTLPMIRDQDPDGAAVMEKLADSLNAQGSGTAVSITVPTPDGFEEWVVKQAGMLEAMLGGGIPGQ